MKVIKNHPNFIESILEYLNSIQKESILLVDKNVDAIYSDFWKEYPKIIIPSGESSKSFEFIQEVIAKLLEMNAHRDNILIGIGGGVTTDITGFVASIYKRGLDFAFLPTTLLAMCDAALGGKNGINIGTIKNCVGTINQPKSVAIYPDFLDSLSDLEFQNGLGEVIKHAILSGPNDVGFLLKNAEKIKNKDSEIIGKLIEKSIQLKMGIVEKDTNESNERRLLNFGHTLGHAIETSSYLSHGESVAIGIWHDTILALKNKYCTQEVVDIIKNLFETFDFDLTINIDFEILEEKILHDKKRYNEEIYYIFPFQIGDCRIIKIEYSKLIEQLKDIIHG
ncbi:MAG: 3-dehydroquinate synthase family protein [Bacteroidales bacterium]|nr:3-dehydroquinate synthase family protein [Bacteroidales bacterium]